MGGGVSILQAGPLIFPVLEALEKECRKVKTAEEVRTIIGKAGENLRKDFGTLSGSSVVPLLDSEEYQNLFENGKMASSEEGWNRLLYSLNNQCSSFSRNSFSPKTAEEQGGLSMRLPLLQGSPEQGLIEWLRFLRPEIDPMVPIFLTAPHDRDWVDVIVGEPDPNDFSCLKLNKEGIPALDQVPYNIPEPFQEYAQSFIRQWKSTGTTETGVFFPGLENGNSGNSSKKGAGHWIRSLFGKV